MHPSNAPFDTERNKKAFNFMILGMFMAILDIQIVASSINEIQAHSLLLQMKLVGYKPVTSLRK
jgi:hypothetical protein